MKAVESDERISTFSLVQVRSRLLGSLRNKNIVQMKECSHFHKYSHTQAMMILVEQKKLIIPTP